MALMDGIASLTQWFAGGDTPYHNLIHCMSHDTPWITATVALDVIVAVGYVLIAYHWRQNEKLLSPSPARKALSTMRGIFTFCGICGYVFVPIKMVWPAWRLYDGFMLVLVFYTWTYALNAKRLKVVYTAIGRSEGLAEDLSKAREESARKTFFLNAISHDLRTPLNGLLLSADLAEMHVQDGDASSAETQLAQIKASAPPHVRLVGRAVGVRPHGLRRRPRAAVAGGTRRSHQRSSRRPRERGGGQISFVKCHRRSWFDTGIGPTKSLAGFK